MLYEVITQLTANRTDLVTAVHFEDGQHVEKGDLLVEKLKNEAKVI